MDGTRTIGAAALRGFVEAVFAAAGCGQEEAGCIADRLVSSNLAGHDSHGVIRVPSYVQWLREGKVAAGRTVAVVIDSGPVLVLDGQFGFGQSIGSQAMELAIRRTAAQGVCVMGLRNSGHLGRIGDWPEMATAAGLLSLHWVNTSGAGILVAPHGGVDRRLSANPIAAGIPRRDGPPVIVDVSACTIAEGKIRVALNQGAQVPPGCIIDGEGRPTTDPATFYSDPGAILPIAGHKGYALGLICEALAGALAGGGCSNPEHGGRVVNGMLSILLDRSFFGSTEAFDAEIDRFLAYVKTSRRVEDDGEILLPGEPELRCRARRTAGGVPLDAATRAQLLETAAVLGVDAGALQ